MDSGAEHREVGRLNNKGGVYHYHSRPPRYGSGVDQGRGNGRQMGFPGRGINFRHTEFDDRLTERRYCKYFNAGRCKFGASCQNIHDPSELLKGVPPPQPCKFFASGHCNYGAYCRNIHCLPNEE